MSSKTLVLIRHGHALEGSDDVARELSERGRARVRAQALTLVEGGPPGTLLPDQVLCSPAVRTRQTCDLLFAELGLEAPRLEPEGLYLASTGALWRFIQSTPAAVGCLWVVGHNPGLSDLVLQLAQRGATFVAGAPSELAPADYVAVTSAVERWTEFAES